jgi:hypothetical protein
VDVDVQDGRMRGWTGGLLLGVWACACAGQTIGPREEYDFDFYADIGPDFTVLVGEIVSLSPTSESGEVERYQWSFGDGTMAEGQVVEKSWDVAGNYQVVLEVTSEDGERNSDVVAVSVYHPPAAIPPVHSTTLARAKGILWVVEADADRLVGVGESRNPKWAGPTCDEPRSVAVVDGVIAVACAGDGQLCLHPVDDPGKPDCVALGAGTRPVAVVGRGGTWWVALSHTGQIARITGGEVETFAVGPDPRGLLLDPEGRLWVSRFRSPDGQGLLWVVVDPLADQPAITEVSLGDDPGPDSDTANRGVPNLLGQLAMSPDGLNVVVPGLIANTSRGGFRDGQALTFETTARGALFAVDPVGEAPTERFTARKAFDNADRAVSAAWGPFGSVVWVAHVGTGTVEAVDAYTHAVRGAVVHAGQGIEAVQLSTDGTVVYVHASLDREVRSWDVADLAAGPILRWSFSTVDEEPLAPEIFRGKQIFHDSFNTRMSKDGYLHCASCHPDGDHDGLTWDFTDRGEGLRNTTSLWGRGGTAMGPLHWTGNFDEVQDFENDIRHAFSGLGFLADAEFATCEDTLGPPKAGLDPSLDALSAYVTSLDAVPASPWPADPDGVVLLATKGCLDCHSGPLFTDSALDAPLRHDVGTILASSGSRLGGELDGFDTPTLLGVHATGPWLHDGRAATLEEAVTAHQGVDLSPEELSSVVAALRGL